MKKFLSMLALIAVCGIQSAFAVSVKVTMNTTAKTMTLVEKNSKADVAVGTPEGTVYTFDVAPGTYVLTGWDSDAHTKDYGTIEIEVGDAADQAFQVFTVTAQCQSFYADTKTGWAYGTDWTVKDVTCRTREGKLVPVTISDYTLVNTSGNKYQYKYMLTLNGTSYSFTSVPSDALKAQGYMETSCSGTVTGNANSTFTMPKGGEFTITFPVGSNLKVARKPGGTNGSGSVHYVLFDDIQPVSKTVSGGNNVYKYNLADGTTYNYRLWKQGKRTKAGIFVYYIGSSNDGKVWSAERDGFRSLDFTNDDLAEDARWMNKDVTANNKANVANIMLTVNERGHLSMHAGDVKTLGAQRDWQLTNSSTGNYFIEPDYHYTVLNLDGTTGNDVVSITKAEGDFSPWATLKANKAGSALVLVSYDAMKLTQWARSGSGTASSPYKMAESDFLYGSEWSALWPENTGAFIVTVDAPASSLDSKMYINEKYNADTFKNAGAYVDAEHDVFYYLKGTAGYEYTFAPEQVADVQIAYPTLTETSVAYNGFSTNGVTKNEDGTYTVLLKHGRQIVCLTGTDGNKSYQVLTAKECERVITNKTHNDGNFYPGDNVEIQYSGLYHPANKISGIYNMSAFVTYKGLPNGTEVTQTANQYQFCGTPTAQLVKMQIPSGWEPGEPFVMNDACIQVSGFGDPIGNHRIIDPVAGRSPNFTAISHQTYFGALPDVEFEVATPDYIYAEFDITPKVDSEITLVNSKGEMFAQKADGRYYLIPGTYNYTIVTDGYKYVSGTFDITGNETEVQRFTAELKPVDKNGWDGISIREPKQVTAAESAAEGKLNGLEGYYKITNGYELAWVANNVNVNKVAATNAVLLNDITLSDMPWNTIGNSANTPYKGVFEGNGYTISDLLVNATKQYTNSLFGYCDGVTIRNFTLQGIIMSTATYTGAVACRLSGVCTLSDITSRVDISMPGTTGSAYASGIAGWLVGSNTAKYTIERCVYDGHIDVASRNYAAGIVGYNSGNYDNIIIRDCAVRGTIKGGNYIAGIIANFGGANSAKAKIENCYNAAKITATGSSVGAVWAYTNAATGVDNCYTTANYKLTSNQGELVSADQMASGEVAYLLGDAWGQEIGFSDFPELGGMKVFYDEATDVYYNEEPEPETNYDLRVLTFEDKDWKAGTNCAGGEDWSSLIDEPQYGGPLLYGDGGMGFFDEDDYYHWEDFDNTFLSSMLSYAWGSWCYWSGGHAVSNYASGDFSSYGGFESQLTVYKKGVDGLAQKGAGHNGSDNFAVHYGYSDSSGYSMSEEDLPMLYFADGEARVIDHMYVNNTCYALNAYLEGNGLTPKISEDDWVKIVATADNGNTAEFYLCNGPSNIVTDWTKWDLSGLGEVTCVWFNITGSSDNGFGFSQPAYFAYDDVAVRFPKQADVTIGTGGWSTFAAAFDAVVPEGVEAYYATMQDGKAYLHKIEDGIIAKGEGVVLKGEEGQTYTMTATNEEAQLIEGNCMVGVLDADEFVNDGNVYVVATKNDVTAFYRYTASVFPVGKAYLKATGMNAAKAIPVLLDGEEATGVGTIATDSSTDGPAYRLDGVRANSNASGIIIINGKKYYKK